jgi:hypothetical protein
LTIIIGFARGGIGDDCRLEQLRSHKLGFIVMYVQGRSEHARLMTTFYEQRSGCNFESCRSERLSTAGRGQLKVARNED